MKIGKINMEKYFSHTLVEIYVIEWPDADDETTFQF